MRIQLFGLILTVFLGAASTVSAGDPRTLISLDGAWQIDEGGMQKPPRVFNHTVPVPGLASLATPPFADPPGPPVKNLDNFGFKDPKRDAFWYRRTFRLDRIPVVATIKIRKAMFGTKVILNGEVLGEHQPSFTPGYFNAKRALRLGENELIVRVGADRAAATSFVPSGQDFEKSRYIPGIFDSVELILSRTPHILNLQVAPEIENKTVRIQTHLRNEGKAAIATVSFVIREWRSGTVVGRLKTEPVKLGKGAEAKLDVRIPISNCRLWSPEDPFLYTVEADSGGDRVTTRFGMRSFAFDPASGKAMLNGKVYFMRGSNVTLYRFFEDEAAGALPWNKAWVRQLHRRIKDMHWNSLRYCIGFPPESWYEIADEEGVLIQDEFPIWSGDETWPAELKRDELAREYAEWMRDRWNHPSVVVWDASNETTSPETAPAIQMVRALDLSDRPWDNSYSTPSAPGDSFESHPYHFQDPKFKLSDLATTSTTPEGNTHENDGKHAVIINEYGWLWLNRDGTPTTLTQELYNNLLGPSSTTEQRRELYARYLAAETEFWRAHRNAAAVMHFTALGYSRPDGQTSDHWIDVAKLKWEPKFYEYVRDAFAPTALMINAWASEYSAGTAKEFQVTLINDLYESWKGSVRMRLLQDGKVVQEKSQPCEISSLGGGKLFFTLDIPARPGSYQLEAALIRGNDTPVRSLRDFNVLP